MIEAAGTCGLRVRFFFIDEVRFGRRGTTTRVWAKGGSRPNAVRWTRYEWLYLFAAVKPKTGYSVALQAPHANTGAMNVFRGMLSEDLGPDEHSTLRMDRAGWHKARKLVMPNNITIPCRPPHSLELNPSSGCGRICGATYLSDRV